MKTLFIQIEDPSEIDTTKATIYDLNKRYIDHSGNMYSLRYNRDAKKVEVIKVMRTTAKNESYFTQRMMIQKKTKTDADPKKESDELQPVDEQDQDIPVEYGSDEEPLDPTLFREELFTLMLTHKERLNTIVKNIYNSKIVPREQRDAAAKLDELFRNIDIDCSQRIDKIINSYREMTEYPRSLNYYIGRLENKARELIGGIRNEESKLHFVILHEMHGQSRDLFTALKKMLKELSSFLQERKEERLPKLAALEKQALTDALTSIESTISEIQIETEKLHRFENYIYTISNFQRN